ncbi:MAG: hypothetical protein WCO45_11385 [Pseudanabaena sp. ELA607]
MEKYLDKYVKVGQGAWAAKALYDEVVTALLTQQFSEVKGFTEVFDAICGDFGGEAAYIKLQKAANLLAKNSDQDELARKILTISNEVRGKSVVPSCTDLSEIEHQYDSREIILFRIGQICSFLSCDRQDLEITLKAEIESDTIPTDWDLQIPNLYSRAYKEWFTEVADKYLNDFLPVRESAFSCPEIRIAGWSSEVWRCWRLLDRPTLVDPAIFRPAQVFVWHIIHDSVHIWQMQAYNSKWSNVLSPNEYLFLEAQAMCVERICLHLLQNSLVEVPSWYPSSQKAIILRLLIGLLEREIRLDLDLQVHLHGQNFTDWLQDICTITNLSPAYFQGLTAELLGMPGFCAAYTVATDNFQNMTNSHRKAMLQDFPNIDYRILGSIYRENIPTKFHHKYLNKVC